MYLWAHVNSASLGPFWKRKHVDNTNQFMQAGREENEMIEAGNNRSSWFNTRRNNWLIEIPW